MVDLVGSRVESRFGPIRAGALAIDPSGQPVVADATGDRLLVFDPQWTPRFEIGGPGSGSGAFRDPSAVAIAPNGRIWVADRGNHLVQVLDPVGAFLAEHEFENAPESLSIDEAGRVIVGDAGGVVTFLGGDGSRQILPAPPGSRGTAYVVVTGDGTRLYVARPVSGIVEVYEVAEDPSGS